MAVETDLIRRYMAPRMSLESKLIQHEGMLSQLLGSGFAGDEGGAAESALETATEIDAAGLFSRGHQLLYSKADGTPAAIQMPEHGWISREAGGEINVGSLGEDALIYRFTNNVPGGGADALYSVHPALLMPKLFIPLTVNFTASTSITLSAFSFRIFAIKGVGNGDLTFDLPASGTVEPGQVFVFANFGAAWSGTRRLVLDPPASGVQINNATTTYITDGASKLFTVLVLAARDGSTDEWLAADFTDHNA